ncbi:hypothetical protein BCR36DRAFT_366960 [Piromyces finnis]|uniref:Uncharacterized protein n=1 Tax=Piromyces finnis TaxID=1754191 RepID=A0A1Y1VKW7_9FUNG|nr:hypothetical protein BCR36DRAFT_366960 [Piromyces finnis]|eukprot:ORX57756.1 hypothetical protein BCR36DRAFT_366960 [Piromyces finnis]
MAQLFQLTQNYTMPDTRQNISATSGQSHHSSNNLMSNPLTSTTTTAEYMKWSDSEISMLLQWLKKPENMDLFFNKKKVTAIKKMREFLQQKTERQIKNKLASLESNYKKTKQKLIANWDLTAVSAQDSETYAIAEEKIKRTCPFYDDLDEIFGSYINVVQSPLNVDLANTPSNTTTTTISTAIDHSDINNINMSTIDVNSINGVNNVHNVNSIGISRNGLTNSATINNHNNLGNELEIHNKRNIRKASNISQLLVDSNLPSLLQIIDSRIIQNSDLILSKASSSISNTNNEQILLLKERLYDKKIQSRERQMDKKKKMFEIKMRLKEKKLELYSKELEIRRFEAEVRMEEIKLKRLLYEGSNSNNRGNHIRNTKSTTSLGLSTITSTASPTINVSPFGSGNLNNSFNNHSNHFKGVGSSSGTTNDSESSTTSIAVINRKNLLNDEKNDRLCLISSSHNMDSDNNAATTINPLNLHTKTTTISSSNTTTSILPINQIPTAPTSSIITLMNSSISSPSSFSETNDEKL